MPAKRGEGDCEGLLLFSQNGRLTFPPLMTGNERDEELLRVCPWMRSKSADETWDDDGLITSLPKKKRLHFVPWNFLSTLFVHHVGKRKKGRDNIPADLKCCFSWGRVLPTALWTSPDTLSRALRPRFTSLSTPVSISREMLRAIRCTSGNCCRNWNAYLIHVEDYGAHRRNKKVAVAQCRKTFLVAP